MVGGQGFRYLQQDLRLLQTCLRLQGAGFSWKGKLGVSQFSSFSSHTLLPEGK